MRNEWDLPRLDAWSRYCALHPTVRAMVQGYLGIKTEPDQGQPDLLDMIGMFPGAQEKPR